MKPIMSRIPWIVLLLWLSSNPVVAILPKIDFVHEVMPILKKHCAECHTKSKKKGGLSINTRSSFLAGGENGKVAVPGKPGDSFFL